MELIKYSIADAEIAKLSPYLKWTVSGLDDKKGIAEVHTGRMHMKNLRVGVEKQRKELKAYALNYGRDVDKEAKRLTALMAPIETHLAEQESIVAIEKARIKREKEEAAEAERLAAEALREAKLQDRLDKLAAAKCMTRPAIVEALSPAEFAELLAVSIAHHEKHVAVEAEAKRLAEAEAERQRIEAARLAEERAKLEAEALRQRKERQEEMDRQQAERDKIESDRQAIDDRNAAYEEQKEHDRLEAERIKQAEADRLAAVEQAKLDERNRIEAEAAAKLKAEEEAEAERLREEAMRPDIEKIRAFAQTVDEMPVPELSEAFTEHQGALAEIMENTVDSILSLAEIGGKR